MVAMARRIALLVAVAQEGNPVARRLGLTERHPGGILHGTREGMEVALAVGGMGAHRAALAADRLIEEWRPDLLLIAGVAGALAPGLSVGDLVVADAVCSEGPTLRPTLPAIPGPEARIGGLLSLDRVLVTADEKRLAREGYPDRPLAIEMETAAAARIAVARGVAWGAVRAISDRADEALPLDFNRLRGPGGDLPTSRVALAALFRPASIPGLLRLGKNTSLAAERLAEFLHSWTAALAEADNGRGTPAR
ncbi:MAG TPA: hypothetical protein VFU47_15645 [Armatimonadota bacterium]|nr:hypothetical protein [Armatimonadota bacterium]